MFSTRDERAEGASVCPRTFETPFVGRHNERELVKDKLKKDLGLVQIVGGPAVGKSRLAKQICHELLEESKDTETDLRIVQIPLRNKDAECLQIVEMRILQSFGYQGSYSGNFKDAIMDVSHSDPDRYFLVLFDDCDQMVKTRNCFLELVSCLVEIVPVMVILTSRVRFALPRIHYCFFCPLTGLPRPEATELLSLTATNVTFDEDALQTIQDRCCGLPLLLIIVARTLEEKRDMLKPQDLCELWETFPIDMLTADLASDEDNIEEIIGKFVSSLDKYLQRALAVFAYFPGTFSADGAAFVGRYQRTSHAKGMALIPLYDRSFVEFDSVKKRFSILPVIRSFVNKNFTHLRNTDTVRSLFCDFFGKLLIVANKDLTQKSTDIVIGNAYEEWVNVEQTLREAVLPTADLFQLNMKIVRDAPDIIVAMVPEIAEDYYRQCLPAAEMFGTQEDIACIQACIGCVTGYSRGNGLQEAIRYLKEAESKLSPKDGYQYVKLMAHFEWNYFRQGNMAEAGRYQQMGLSVVPEGPEKRRIIRQQIAIMNHKALRLIIEADCQEAIDLLLETLHYSKQHFEHLPTFRVMLNSLGLAYSGLEQPDMALKYCKASLVERRMYASRSPRDLVVALSNVATMLSNRGQFKPALELVKEAVGIRKKISWEHLDTATAYLSKGTILRKWGKYLKATKALVKAHRIYEKCAKTHFLLADVKIQIAQCLEGLKMTSVARAMYRHVINNRTILQQNHQLITSILQAFDHLLELSGEDDWHSTARELCHFLESVINSADSLDSKKTALHREKMHNITTEIKHRETTKTTELPSGFKACSVGGAAEKEDFKKMQLLKSVSKLESHQNNLASQWKEDKTMTKNVCTNDMLNQPSPRDYNVSHLDNVVISPMRDQQGSAGIGCLRHPPTEHDERDSNHNHVTLEQFLKAKKAKVSSIEREITGGWSETCLKENINAFILRPCSKAYKHVAGLDQSYPPCESYLGPPLDDDTPEEACRLKKGKCDSPMPFTKQQNPSTCDASASDSPDFQDISPTDEYKASCAPCCGNIKDCINSCWRRGNRLNGKSGTFGGVRSGKRGAGFKSSVYPLHDVDYKKCVPIDAQNSCHEGVTELPTVMPDVDSFEPVDHRSEVLSNVCNVACDKRNGALKSSVNSSHDTVNRQKLLAATHNVRCHKPETEKSGVSSSHDTAYRQELLAAAHNVRCHKPDTEKSSVSSSHDTAYRQELLAATHNVRCHKPDIEKSSVNSRSPHDTAYRQEPLIHTDNVACHKSGIEFKSNVNSTREMANRQELSAGPLNVHRHDVRDRDDDDADFKENAYVNVSHQMANRDAQNARCHKGDAEFISTVNSSVQMDQGQGVFRTSHEARCFACLNEVMQNYIRDIGESHRTPGIQNGGSLPLENMACKAKFALNITSHLSDNATFEAKMVLDERSSQERTVEERMTSDEKFPSQERTFEERFTSEEGSSYCSNGILEENIVQGDDRLSSNASTLKENDLNNEPLPSESSTLTGSF